MDEASLTASELQTELLLLVEFGVSQATDRMWIENLLTDLLVRENADLMPALTEMALRMFDDEIAGAQSSPRIKPRWQKGLIAFLRKWKRLPPDALMRVREKLRQLFQYSSDYMNDMCIKQYNAEIVRACAALVRPAPLTQNASLAERRHASYHSRRG